MTDSKAPQTLEEQWQCFNEEIVQKDGQLKPLETLCEALFKAGVFSMVLEVRVAAHYYKDSLDGSKYLRAITENYFKFVDGGGYVIMTDGLSKPGGWTCFHCGFNTCDRREAETHFGKTPDTDPLCRSWNQLGSTEQKIISELVAKCLSERLG